MLRNVLPLGLCLSAFLSFGTVIWSADPPDVEALTKSLSAKTPAEREKGIIALSQLGPGAGEAAGQIGRLLDDPSPRVRREALLCLEQIGPAAGAAVEPVMALLDKEDGAMKRGAIHVLGAIGVEAKEAVPRLREIAEDEKNPGMAAAALVALIRIQPDDKDLAASSIPMLLRALKDENVASYTEAGGALARSGAAAVPELTKVVQDHARDPAVAVRAAAVLGLIGPESAPAVPALIDALASDNVELQQRSAWALGVIGAEGAKVVEPLTKLFHSKNVAVRAAAVDAVGRFGSASPKAVPALMERLKDDDARVRREAAAALGALGPDAAEAVPALIEALRDPMGTVTLQAAASLGMIGSASVGPVSELLQDEELQGLALLILSDLGDDASEAIPAVVKLIGSRNDELVREAHLFLAQMGKKSQIAEGALLKSLKDEKSKVRASAAYALIRIGAGEQTMPILQEALSGTKDAHLQRISAWGIVRLNPAEATVKSVVPILIGGLKDAWPLVRRESAEALAQLGPKASAAVSDLAAVYPQEKDPVLRNAQIRALAAIGPAAEPALTTILQAMNDPAPYVRYSACYATGQIGPAASRAVPVLRNQIKGDDKFLAFVSSWALARIDPEQEGLADDIVPILKDYLEGHDSDVRIAALEALGELGRGAEPALNDIEAMTRDKDETVRDAAKLAREKIVR
jgi:HEAT repeat protein